MNLAEKLKENAKKAEINQILNNGLNKYYYDKLLERLTNEADNGKYNLNIYEDEEDIIFDDIKKLLKYDGFKIEEIFNRYNRKTEIKISWM